VAPKSSPVRASKAAPARKPTPAKKAPKPAAKKDAPQRLIILDGHGLIYRAYYALPEPLTVRRTGEVVTAVYGFANSLITVLNELKPTHVAVALDPPGPTFRHEKDDTYKSNRFDALKASVTSIVAGTKAPDAIKRQLEETIGASKSSQEIEKGLVESIGQLDIPERLRQDLLRATQPVQALREIGQQSARVQELIEAFGIPIYVAPGFEADDVLGTLAHQAEKKGIETFLVTLDSDVIQLVRDSVVKVFMLRPYQRDTVTYDADLAKERYGIEPEQMPDLKGLKGDTSDNIPGVPGVGEKTAVKLIDQFGTIENLYKHIDEVTPEKLRENLREHEAIARHSKDMATISTKAPVKLDLKQCEFSSYDREAAAAFLRDLEFKSLVPRLPESTARPAVDGAAKQTGALAIAGQDYRTVHTEKELDALAKDLRTANVFSFDTETTGVDPLRAALVGLSFAWGEGKAA
jgi:DNA polymerase-1